MKIEDNIFKKCKFNINALIPYGFRKDKDKFLYSKNIVNDRFRVNIEIDNKKKISGKIIELDFDEEYINFRNENIVGDFVSLIRNEYENILNDIKDKCCITNNYASDQANRIAALIKDKYNDEPEFLWKGSPDSSIFRKKDSNKWYAIIMGVNKSKITSGNEYVEAINVKLDKSEVEKLLNVEGFYKAYHMNKQHWITIILDDSKSDEEIMSLIVKSYNNT